MQSSICGYPANANRSDKAEGYSEERKGNDSDVPATAEDGSLSAGSGGARSIEIAKHGIRTGDQFAGFMSALIGDIMDGRVTPQVANAAINAGGKLLKVVDMQARYGKTGGGGDSKLLELVK